MAWLLERAVTTPATAGPMAGQPISEFQIWTSVEDNQRAVKAERPDAPSYVQQYLAERRTFVNLCKFCAQQCHRIIWVHSTDA